MKNQNKSNKSKQINQLKKLFCFKFILTLKISQSKTNKQTGFTQNQDQVSNLRDQCTFLKKSPSIMHLHNQFSFYFLNIEEKIYTQLICLLQGKFQLYEMNILVIKAKFKYEKISQINKSKKSHTSTIKKNKKNEIKTNQKIEIILNQFFILKKTQSKLINYFLLKMKCQI
ncbi:hypothetical protein TTHERM_000425919 (macronuclear) [Tetrahymena thermophila SB210]|uniref:Uncharacterized protein n=1 Tax=Tetrahymena thermophila (strain SB210) TaxID=312017 RepID=W7XIV7_TETTS|nr:hypothetical protein TTHERM_000425919 [Tetrahymena thermophila SB210]EWS74961.1 hypothetical protein TTHERM_000425919 [Tetrahymena thermophila SB210]|eukprot:XP_012652502.1 hypothetical protein TTHERM_000425919 [Tetrahymena thermophila SB210]